MSASVHSGECHVYLCSTPIQQGGSGNLPSRALSWFASSSRSLCGDSWNKHWLVIFDYGDETVIICDADRDSEGELTGRRCVKKRDAFEKSYPKKTYLGKHNVPEWLLDKALEKMCDSGTYHLTNNNCQTWVVGLLRELDIKTPDEERHAEKVVNDVIIPGAALGGGVLGRVLLGAVMGPALAGGIHAVLTILFGRRRNNRRW